MLPRARRLRKPLELLPACGPFDGGVWADVGCGDGIFTEGVLAQDGAPLMVFGLDRDLTELKRMAAWAESLAEQANVRMVQADVLDALPFRSLDGILAANVLHFVPLEQKARVLGGFLRALKPGGKLIIVEYSAVRGNGAVPHPLTALGWLDLIKGARFSAARVAARVPSTFLGEMAAITATRPGDR